MAIVNNLTADINDLWGDCLSEIRSFLPDQTWQTWFKPLKAKAISGEKLTLTVPNKFYSEWIEQHYKDLIRSTFQKLTGMPVDLAFDISLSSVEKKEMEDRHRSELIPRKKAVEQADEVRLNERYTFDTYVEGPHNQFAKVASKAVSESPGNTSFNPLLIYGGSGLGKTHLLQAIGNKVRKSFPAKRIMYVSSEKFMLDYISSLQNNKMHEFSSKYRKCDLLLVDDIQFLQAKEGTQEQFFHTFNELYHAGKQIVITADRTPKEMKGVEERLISRFLSGLMVDIQPPDLETRIAILKNKAQTEELEIPDDVINFIANNIKSNVRELESATIKVFAYSSLKHMDIDISLAKKVIKDILGVKPSTSISIDHIVKSVARIYRVSENEIIGKSRQKIIALARQVAMYFARELSGDSLKSIGLRLGGRDHSTVIHACSSIAAKIKNDATFSKEMDTLRSQIELNIFE